MDSNVKYKGLTKRRYKQIHGSSEKGINKGETCKATGLDKAMSKYPRSHKSHPLKYLAYIDKKDRANGIKRNTL